MPHIELEQISYALKPHFYSRRRSLLKNVSFAVEQGEIFGFLGPNGAGKTTTIKVLLNLISPNTGHARLMGQSCALPQARAKVGFLPERTYYPAHLSAEEFVLGHAMLSGLSYADAKARTRTALERTGVASVASQRLRTFSKGMLQRTGLAQAIVGDPDIVILDEPMSGLDPLGRRHVREIMQELKKQGKTVFFSTHILPDVELICDKVAMLVGGELRRVGPLAELIAGYAQGVEVTVAAANQDVVTRLAALSRSHHAHAAGHTFEALDIMQANTIIDAARAAGAHITAVQAGHGGLEQLFVGEAAR